MHHEHSDTPAMSKITASKVLLESFMGAVSVPFMEAPFLELIARCRARPG